MSGFMSLKLLDENNNTNDDICYFPVENLVEKDLNTLKLNVFMFSLVDQDKTKNYFN